MITDAYAQAEWDRVGLKTSFGKFCARTYKSVHETVMSLFTSPEVQAEKDLIAAFGPAWRHDKG